MFRLPWLLSFAFVGPVALVAAWIGRRKAPLLAGFLLCATIVIAMFHVCDRTRLPILAGAIPFVGFGLDRFVSALSRAAAKARSWPGAALAEVACAHGRTLIALGLAFAFVMAPFPGLRRTEPGPGWVALARAHEAAGDLVAARDAYASAERSGMRTAELYSSWGRVEQMSGLGIQAEQHLLTAINLDPGYGAAHETLGNVYFERGSYAQAAQEYAIAAGIYPARAAELWTHAGEALEELGNRERAAEMFGRALRAQPGYAAAEAGLERSRR
jgi:tetratricopeptide (TPR) repeat protein